MWASQHKGVPLILLVGLRNVTLKNKVLRHSWSFKTSIGVHFWWSSQKWILASSTCAFQLSFLRLEGMPLTTRVAILWSPYSSISQLLLLTEEYLSIKTTNDTTPGPVHVPPTCVLPFLYQINSLNDYSNKNVSWNALSPIQFYPQK